MEITRKELEEALKKHSELEEIVGRMETFEEAIEHFSEYDEYEENFDIQDDPDEDDEALIDIEFNYGNIRARVYGVYENPGEEAELGWLSDDIGILDSDGDVVEYRSVKYTIKELK